MRLCGWISLFFVLTACQENPDRVLRRENRLLAPVDRRSDEQHYAFPEGEEKPNPTYPWEKS